jgi:uncharacterized membrane protein
MSGLVTVLPVALTVYVIWWVVHTLEEWLRRALIALDIVSPEHYWPGLGLIAGFMLLLAVGSLVNAYAGKIFLKYWDDFLAHPVRQDSVRRVSRCAESAAVRQRREARSAARRPGAISARCMRSDSSRAKTFPRYSIRTAARAG